MAAAPDPPPFGAPAPRPPDLSGLAVGALISSVLFSPLGVVLGVIAKAQIRRTGQSGDRLATAAIVIGAVATVLLVLLAN